VGLDMYLYKSEFISGYSFNKDERFDQIRDAIGIPVCEDSPHITVDVCVAYWRKANAIHGWFVEHVQNGEDECKPHELSLSKLHELRDACLTVLETKSQNPKAFENIARSVLPPREGFFFGVDDVGESYIHDLQLTLQQIDHITNAAGPELSRLSSNEHTNEPEELVFFTYRSSW